MKIFTLGYQNLKFSEFIETLSLAGVGMLLDVRDVPWSNRPEYRKKALEQALADAGIGYVHVKSAGNPESIRKASTPVSRKLTAFRDHLRANPTAIDDLLGNIREAASVGKTACLMCYERFPAECHRSVLVEEMIERDGEIECVHLFHGERRVMRIEFEQCSMETQARFLGGGIKSFSVKKKTPPRPGQGIVVVQGKTPVPRPGQGIVVVRDKTPLWFFVCAGTSREAGETVIHVKPGTLVEGPEFWPTDHVSEILAQPDRQIRKLAEEEGWRYVGVPNQWYHWFRDDVARTLDRLQAAAVAENERSDNDIQGRLFE